MRIYASGLRKLLRRPATWVTLRLLCGLMVLIFVAVGASANRIESTNGGAAIKELLTFPGAYDRLLEFLLGLGGLFAVIYAASVAGSEWNWGMLKAAVARGESRTAYAWLSFAAVATLIALGLLVAFAIGVVAAVIGANLAGISTSGIGDAATIGQFPYEFARGWLGIIEEGALGFTIATLARSQLAGIGAGIGLYFAESFARIFLSSVVKFLPFDAATALVGGGTSGISVGGGGAGASVETLDPGTALVVVIAWLVVALIVVSLFTERAEISG